MTRLIKKVDTQSITNKRFFEDSFLSSELNAKEFITEKVKFTEYDYRGEHQAPSNDGFNKPLYDVTGMFPADFYTGRAYDYRAYMSYDDESINIILDYHNKPNKPVMIYRSIPDFNYEVDIKIKGINSAINYKNRYGFFPMDDKKGFDYFKILKADIENKIDHIKDYDEYNEAFTNLLIIEQEKLRKQKQKKITIEKGDWVSISKEYAIDHGKSNLNNKYKILSKRVKASQVWTDGNSIHEWGYDD